MSQSFQTQSLINWFKEEKRDLPWRKNLDPYAVWVSEVMLQQTLASVVIPYFEKWMVKYPTISELAKSSIDDVIKSWEGLGYYSRARNLHNGAKEIVSNFAGVFPSHIEGLNQIKGLGPYTQGAIRSFAFRQKCAALDGNAFRVLSRYFAIAENIDSTKVKKEFWDLANSILPNDEHWLFNEALIELGAVICKKSPLCNLCPVKSGCLGFKRGIAAQLPVKNKKAAPQKLLRAAVVLKNTQGAYLLRKCDENEIMHGLYEFPYFQEDIQDLDVKILERFGYHVVFNKTYQSVKHTFTRYQVLLHAHLYHLNDHAEIDGYQWFLPKDIEKIAFSSGHRRIWQQLQQDIYEN
ncbi:MAG: A/G-specific adenine glycosylase [Parachlamydiales bacterium]|nr:A/G-specific adenine glycosylase [Parachlamydiales bacterium]